MNPLDDEEDIPFDFYWEAEAAILSYLFYTEEGLEKLSEIEEVVLRVFGVKYLTFDAFLNIVEYSQKVASLLTEYFSVGDSLQLLLTEDFWQWQIEKGLINLKKFFSFISKVV